MSKKLLFLLLLVLFIVGIPFLQFLTFSSSTSSKTVINQEIVAPYLDSIDEKVIILFFGYVGCQTVCNKNFENLNKMLENPKLKKDFDKYKLVFVNLTPEIKKEQVDLYAKSFNENYIGLHLTRQELFKIDREFSLFFSDSLTNNTEVSHTGYIYLLSKNKNRTFLHAMYRKDFSEEKELEEDVLLLIEGE